MQGRSYHFKHSRSSHPVASYQEHAERLWALLDATEAKRRGPLTSRVFCGSAGYAYAAWLASLAWPGWATRAQHWAIVALHAKPPRRLGTFVEGTAGPPAVALCVGVGAEAEVAALADIARAVSAQGDAFACELWYGRAGVLHAMLVARGDALEGTYGVECSLLWDDVLRLGRKDARGVGDGGPPLLWHWHSRAYLGAVHGVAGIVAVLLRIWSKMGSVEWRAQRERDYHDLVATAQWLVGLRDHTGNWPAYLGDDDADLVQLCHGAPGIALMCVVVYRVTAIEFFREAAKQCGQTVYEVSWTV